MLELIPVRTKADSPTKVCTETNCERPLRARGLCSTHYNHRHQPGRHQKVAVPCDYCGTLTEKQPTSKYAARFCSYTCRDLWRIETGTNPAPCPIAKAAYWEARRLGQCAVPDDHPSRWIGATCAVSWRDCLDCGAPIVGRGRRIRCAKCAVARKYTRRSGRWSRRRTIIFDRDNWVCWLCGHAVDPTLRVPHPFAATVDHVMPVHHGGGDESENLACAHLRCNSSRGDSLVHLDGSYAA